MEYRKLIKFGNSSFIVSLPKIWVEKHNLKKGDSIHLNINGNGELMISPKIIESTKEKKGITIDTNNKDIFYIKREIISAYINNYQNIVITGESLMEKSIGIREILNELVALEIMEQSSTRISAKDFLDMDNISIQNIVRKIDMIVRSTLFDIKTLAKSRKKTAEIAYSRDKDINRLTILALRTIKYGINNSAFLNTNKAKPFELLELYTVATHLEKIADEAKRISKILDHFIQDHMKSNEEAQYFDELLNILIEIESVYINAMKSFYKKDRHLAYDLAEKRSNTKQKLAKLEDNKQFIQRSKKIIEKMNVMLGHVHVITRLSYQG